MAAVGDDDDDELKVLNSTIASESTGVVDSSEFELLMVCAQLLRDAQFLTSPDGNSGQSFDMLPPSPYFAIHDMTI